MPLYEYQCQQCGDRTETLQRMADPPLTVCAVCGGPLKRLVSKTSMHFKGSGWYVTDYARKGTGAPAKGEGASGGSQSEGQSGESKAAGESNAASEAKPATSASGGSSSSTGASSGGGSTGSSSGSSSSSSD